LQKRGYKAKGLLLQHPEKSLVCTHDHHFCCYLAKTYNPSYNWQSQVQDKVETKELSSDSLIIVAALLSAGSHGHDL
jgi:hypothetical protein